jgi:hypothetical protein
VPLGVTTYTSDDLSRIRAALDGRGVTIRYYYDERDRVVKFDSSTQEADRSVAAGGPLRGRRVLVPCFQSRAAGDEQRRESRREHGLGVGSEGDPALLDTDQQGLAPASSAPPIAKPTGRVRAVVLRTTAGATAKSVPRVINMYGGRAALSVPFHTDSARPPLAAALLAVWLPRCSLPRGDRGSWRWRRSVIGALPCLHCEGVSPVRACGNLSRPV